VADTRRGLRQFVVGTGGATHHPFVGPALANSEVRNNDTFGVLKLTLHARSYEWQFIPVPGRTFTDSGVGRCH
jgi:acid phosphatase type 7